jgi:hypothetical protein
MMKVVLLVCAAAVPRPECHEQTARLVIQGPDAANEMTCAMRSQAYFAQTTMEIGEAEYLKITCTRTTIGRDNVG